MPVFSGMINNETIMGRVTSKVQSMSGKFLIAFGTKVRG